MGWLSFLGFGGSNLKKALSEGAGIIDVRTVFEYDQGHAKGAINIPLDRIAANVERIRHMNGPLIFVCVSGTRSGKAISLLKQKGLKNLINGGNWEKVARLQKSL